MVPLFYPQPPPKMTYEILFYYSFNTHKENTLPFLFFEQTRFDA